MDDGVLSGCLMQWPRPDICRLFRQLLLLLAISGKFPIYASVRTPQNLITVRCGEHEKYE